MWPFKSNDQLDEIVRQRWKSQWVLCDLYTQDAKAANSARKTANYIYSLVKNLDFPVLISYRKSIPHTMESPRIWDGSVRFAWPSSQDIGIDYHGFDFESNLVKRGFTKFGFSLIPRDNFDEMLKSAFSGGVIRCNFKK